MISLLDLACMVLYVVLCCLGMGFYRCDNVFSLSFPFMDSLDVMGSHVLVEMYCWMDSKLSEVDL